MGWFSWLWGDDDPLSEVDPSLRKFLDQQAPRDNKPAPSHAKSQTTDRPPPDDHNYRSQVGLSLSEKVDDALARKDAAARKEQTQAEDRPLPKESLFQDGRYKDVWKSYRPLSEAEQAGKSDQEKLQDIASGFRERQAQIGRAALENCSNEQYAVHDCFRNGGWGSRMTMCKAENRELERCVTMQRKFLKALGYSSLYERSEEESERIQMHADALYHHMLDQEKAINEAKEKGLPPPELLPLIKPGQGQNAAAEPPQNIYDGYQPPPAGAVSFATLPKPLQERYTKERFEGLDGPELELAKQELDQELAMKQDLVKRFDEQYRKERRERLQRQAEGRERMSDKIKRWFDMRDWSKADEEDAKNARN